MLLVTSLLFRFSDFHRESEQTSSKLHAARAYRGSARPRRAIISCRVAISNADIEPTCSNLSRTDLEGLNSLNWMPCRESIAANTRACLDHRLLWRTLPRDQAQRCARWREAER